MLDPKTEATLWRSVEDAMWTCFQMGGQKANLEALEDGVKMMILMATQKTSGQRGKDTDIDWRNLDMAKMQVCIEAAALVLDERFEKVKEMFTDEP